MIRFHNLTQLHLFCLNSNLINIISYIKRTAPACSPLLGYYCYTLTYISLILFYILHREADSSHLVLAKANNLYLVSKCEYILYSVDSLFCNLRNVNHSLFARSKFDESTELLDAYNCSLKDLSLLKISCDNLNHVDCLCNHLFICSAN